MKAIDRAYILALTIGCRVATRMERPELYQLEGRAFHERTREMAVDAARAALIVMEMREEQA